MKRKEIKMSYSKICLIWFVGFAFLFFIVFGYPPTSRQYIYSFEQKDEEYVFFVKEEDGGMVYTKKEIDSVKVYYTLETGEQPYLEEGFLSDKIYLPQELLNKSNAGGEKNEVH